MESMFRGIRNARRVGFARSFISTHSGSLLLKGKAITEFTESTLDLSEAKTQTGIKKDSVTNARIIGPIGGRCLALIFQFTRAERNVMTTKNVYLGKVTRKGQRVRGVFG